QVGIVAGGLLYMERALSPREHNDLINWHYRVGPDTAHVPARRCCEDTFLANHSDIELRLALRRGGCLKGERGAAHRGYRLDCNRDGIVAGSAGFGLELDRGI